MLCTQWTFSLSIGFSAIWTTSGSANQRGQISLKAARDVTMLFLAQVYRKNYYSIVIEQCIFVMVFYSSPANVIISLEIWKSRYKYSVVQLWQVDVLLKITPLPKDGKHWMPCLPFQESWIQPCIMYYTSHKIKQKIFGKKPLVKCWFNCPSSSQLHMILRCQTDMSCYCNLGLAFIHMHFIICCG